MLNLNPGEIYSFLFIEDSDPESYRDFYVVEIGDEIFQSDNVDIERWLFNKKFLAIFLRERQQSAYYNEKNWCLLPVGSSEVVELSIVIPSYLDYKNNFSKVVFEEGSTP